MIKIRVGKAHDRGKIYELIQRDDQYRAGEIEQILHLIDTFLFETDQKLYSVIIAENGSKEIQTVVVEKDGRNVGIIVDFLIGLQEIVIKTLDNRHLGGLRGFSGATILGDGKVVLILDIGNIM